jgi:hypothetical protein
LTSCETCRHFHPPIGPQGVCQIWHKPMTAAEAAATTCSLWEKRSQQQQGHGRKPSGWR